jgi:hypothetical protein
VSVLAEIEDALAGSADAVVRVPALVQGRLVLAPAPATAPGAADRAVGDDAYVVRRPIVDPQRREPTGEVRTVLLPALDPRALTPDDGTVLALARLPFAEVLAYLGALREAVGARSALARTLSELVGESAPLHVELLRGILDPDGLATAVDLELGSPGVPGRRYLDDWVPAGSAAHRGAAAEIGWRLFGLDGPAPPAPQVRALPTRQLHITAGSSPVISLVSALRAIATKSPAVVKSSSSVLSAALLALAVHSVDPHHPVARGLSLVWWPGGDRRVEDVLLAPGRFDRLVAWGSAATLASLRARAGALPTIFLGPRTGASLIGRGALVGDLADVAARAAADSLADDQQSCSASLVHYVEGSRDEALDYCEALRKVLARWDAALPPSPTPQSTGRLRRLRRGTLIREPWFENVRDGVVTSAVVCVDAGFDVASHPAGRCVIVRPLEDLSDALALLDPGISTVGIAPERRRVELRDLVAARGVSDVVPLGDAERAFAGMPHDGMRILSQLVNWVTA